MKKGLLAILFCMVTYGTAFSKTDESKKSAFQLSFITPLGTNGLHSSQYTNKASFNILVGTSKNEEAFTFGGLSNIIMNNAKGFQLAGLSNYVGNEGQGGQFAGLVNVNKNSFKGFQVAGLVNTAGNMNGFQLGGLTNVSKDTRGLQLAGLVNTAGNMDGFQLGGLTNVSKDTRGFQLAGLVNSSGNVDGFQLAGLTNVAKDVRGFQFAGLINIAKNVKGVQFAGLVNIAENSDCPIGLVNIIKNGEMGIALTYDGIGNAMVSFRSGGKYTYGILGIGYNHKAKDNSLVTEGGFGAHIPVVSWFRINNEIKVSSIGSNADTPILNAGYSLIPAFKIGNHCELFAGASINYMKTWDLNNSNLFPKHSLWEKSSFSTLEQIYIGYLVGVQYLF